MPLVEQFAAMSDAEVGHLALDAARVEAATTAHASARARSLPASRRARKPGAQGGTALSQRTENAAAFDQIASTMFAMDAILTRRPDHLKMPRQDAYTGAALSHLRTVLRDRLVMRAISLTDFCWR
jgi:hypothetical protein